MSALHPPSPVRPCGLVVVGCILLLSGISTTHCLNIDTQFPVLFNYPEPLPSGDSPHFGYSVLILNATQSTPFIFFIGAPNENVELLHTGSVYRCEWRERLDRTSCQRAPVAYDFRSGPTKSMHLGANLVAQPNHEQQYLSCAYSRTIEQNIYSQKTNRFEALWHPTGACYQLRLDQAKPLSSIMPMNDESLQFIMQNSTPVYFYSHAMAGFSSVFSESGNRLFLGAPGYDNWKGALLEMIPSNSGRFQQKGKFIHTIVESKPLRDEFAYLGYSIAIGRFFDDRQVEYAVLGAPRVAFVGSVAFFRLDRTTAQSEAEPPRLQLNGNQSGEYFGSSLLAIDLNGDGRDDLLVGAPMYCSFRKGFSDEGRVFVYLSNGKSMTHQITLYGMGQSDGRFGTSIASLGDINHDGFNDVVVGAPYEDGGKGAIYLYRGSHSGVASNFSQRVAAAEIPRLRLAGFGFSFSGQIDVDGNGFNDLLVGSYLSNNAVLLRSRPIIRLQAFMKISDDYVDLNQTCSLLNSIESAVVPPLAACIGLQFCFNTANFEDSHQASLRATLLVDSQSSNERCYVLLDNGQKMTSYVSSTVLVKKQSEPICSAQYTVVMKEAAKIDNYLNPIVFSLSYDLEHPKLDRTNIYEVSIIEGATTNITTEAYLKMCGSTAKNCISSLQLKPFLWLNDEEEVAVSEEGIELIEGLHRKVKLQIVIINMGDPAFDAKVNLTINSTLSLVSLDKRCQLYNMSTASANSTSIECTLESPQYGNSNFDLVFTPFDTYQPVQFKVEVTVANKLDANSHLVEHFMFSRVKRADINLKIMESPPQIRYKSESANVSFDLMLEIERLNYSTIDLLELFIIYPASHNQHLLASPFLITNLNNRIPLKCEPEKIFSFESPDETSFRPLNILTVENNYKSLNLTCANSKIICKAVKCRVGPMTWQALSSYVKLSSHLMVGTIDERFGHYMYDQIVFNVRVVATIVDSHISSVSGATSAKTVQFAFKAVEPISDEPVPKWPYLVGAIFGLLIVILLSLLLWKCGFFKRGSAKLKEEGERSEEDAPE